MTVDMIYCSEAFSCADERAKYLISVYQVAYLLDYFIFYMFIYISMY